MIRGDLAFRGTVVAAALLIDPRSLGETEARRRILAVYRAGQVVRTTPCGYLVTITNQRIAAAEALGAPVVRSSGLLTTVPLSPAEALSLHAPPGSLVVAVGGELVATDLSAAPVVDPSLWLDCAGYVVAPIDTPPVRFAKLRRERLIPPADPLLTVVPRDEADGWREARAALEKAEKRAKTRAKRTSAGGATGGGYAMTGLASFLGLFAGLLSVLGVGLGKLVSALSPFSSSPSGGPALAPREPPPPGLFERWSTALERLASRVLLSTQLGELIGKKHAQYFEEMMDAFARKDFDEALKRAIPLGGEAGADGFETLFASFAKRGALNITPQLGMATGGFAVGPVGYQSLRDLYRAAFQTLDARGDVDRASFVLAELLRENAEAVAYLERHGRLRLAAELAEHRKLESGLVVRLWFGAGDAVRAIRIARRDEAFAAAVLAAERVEKAGGGQGSAEITRGLRAAWMDTLADAGDLEGAATVALADRQLRPFAVAFWQRGRRAGGAVAGRSLAQALVEGELEDPATGESSSAVAERLLVSRQTDPEDTSGEERDGFVNVLAHVDPRRAAPSAQRIARLAARLTLAGRTGEIARTTVEGLLLVGGDALLSADLPPRLVREETLPHRALLEGVGLPGLSFSDVALANGGRRLLAAGVHGVFLLDRRGRTLARFDAPASAIVVSDSGARALAVAPTGDETHRVTRIDLLGRRAEPWTETKIDTFCQSFDGDTWMVGNGKEFVLLDCLGDRPAPLGKLPYPRDRTTTGTPTLRRERDTQHVVATQHLFDRETRTHALRRTQIIAFTLRGVRDFEIGGQTGTTTDGRAEWLFARPDGGAELARRVDGGRRGEVQQLALPDGLEPRWLRAEAHHTLIGGVRGDDAVLVVVDGKNLRTLLEVRAPRATSIVASEPREGRIAVADDRGRSGVFVLPMVR